MNQTQPAPEVTLIRDYLIQSSGSKLNNAKLDADTDLLTSGILDSLGILQLTAFLADELKIEIADEDFVPENFQTVATLVRFVQSKRES